MNRALLDTDILSEIMRAKNPRISEKARSYRDEYGRFTVSVVTIAEVVKGLVKARREPMLHRFLAELRQFEVLPFTTEHAIVAGRIYAELERAGQPIGRADPMIAATAIGHDLEIVTGNIDHYQRLNSLGFGVRLSSWRG